MDVKSKVETDRPLSEENSNKNDTENGENVGLDQIASSKEKEAVEIHRQNIERESVDAELDKDELKVLKEEETGEKARDTDRELGKELTNKKFKLVNNLKVICKVLFCLMAFVQAGREYVLNSLILSYCVKCLNWEKSEGADVSMVVYLTYTILRLLNIFILKKIRVIWLIIGNILLALICAVFFISINHSNKVLMWVGILVNALSVGTTFTVSLIWSRSFLRITPKFVSSFFLCFYIGTSILPVLAAYLFTEVHCFWYPTINLILSFAWMLITGILLFIKITKKAYIVV
ncbi:unnamed protein product [Dimorphilus gyrociliatus]|uniref:Uncharacterized protein n=1 Tax=Dimorphilus gyrociliatus TaxID=2664684 RepID=A0A7I8WBG5_9ANNE|nr:unnamed protein product [Dimorphilus gyrociliatus]